jgi:hypothetical protein
MDADLGGMSRDQLIAEVKNLRLGIREHSGALVATARAMGSTHIVPDWPQFLRGCIRYRQSLDEQLPTRREAISRISEEIFRKSLWVRGNGESMKIGLSTICVGGRVETAVTGIVLSMILLITSVSGCSSAISNSGSYYQNIPRQPINWRESMTD